MPFHLKKQISSCNTQQHKALYCSLSLLLLYSLVDGFQWYINITVEFKRHREDSSVFIPPATSQHVWLLQRNCSHFNFYFLKKFYVHTQIYIYIYIYMSTCCSVQILHFRMFLFLSCCMLFMFLWYAVLHCLSSFCDAQWLCESTLNFCCTPHCTMTIKAILFFIFRALCEFDVPLEKHLMGFGDWSSSPGQNVTMLRSVKPTQSKHSYWKNKDEEV